GHCRTPPVLPRNRSTTTGTGDRCTAGPQSHLCPLWVKSGKAQNEQMLSALPRKRTSDLSDLTSTLPLVRAGDGPQQRLEAIHVLADVRIEVAQADAARRYALRANLFLELGIRAHGDDRVVEGLQDRGGRFRRGQEAVPRRVWVIDVGRKRGRDRNRLTNRLI